jgi:pimeloyl-ACP methyl ester carboxylesterase
MTQLDESEAHDDQGFWHAQVLVVGDRHFRTEPIVQAGALQAWVDLGYPAMTLYVGNIRGPERWLRRLVTGDRIEYAETSDAYWRGRYLIDLHHLTAAVFFVVGRGDRRTRALMKRARRAHVPCAIYTERSTIPRAGS